MPNGNDQGSSNALLFIYILSPADLTPAELETSEILEEDATTEEKNSQIIETGKGQYHITPLILANSICLSTLEIVFSPHHTRFFL